MAVIRVSESCPARRRRAVPKVRAVGRAFVIAGASSPAALSRKRGGAVRSPPLLNRQASLPVVATGQTGAGQGGLALPRNPPRRLTPLKTEKAMTCDCWLKAHLSSDEGDHIQAGADAADLIVSDFVRQRLLAYPLLLDYSGRKDRPPETLRGDPDLCRRLIDSQPRKWKFMVRVLVWVPGETISSAQENRLMDYFENPAFVGLGADQYHILWVWHRYASHHEPHSVIPRLELSTCRALNAFPPSWMKDFYPIRDFYNRKNSWSRPGDPARARFNAPAEAELRCTRLLR